jgi:hypothetical protein
MNTAVMRVADFSRNMMEEHQNANQQPTPSTTAFSSSPVVTHPDDDEDDVMFLFQTPLQPTTSQRRYLKADRRSSSVANSLHESRTNKKRRLADPGDVIDLTDEPESVSSSDSIQSCRDLDIVLASSTFDTESASLIRDTCSTEKYTSLSRHATEQWMWFSRCRVSCRKKKTQTAAAKNGHKSGGVA